MPAEPTIALEPDPLRPRYVASSDGAAIGEVRLTRLPSGVVTIDHVEVVPALRGRGLAERLVRHVVEESRRAGDRLQPRCPYAVLLFRRKPEWRDVLAG